MRRLFILRGAPKSGKTTWVRDNHLEDYTISVDELRRLFSSPRYDASGHLYVPESRQQVGPFVSKLLMGRMPHGELIVLDGVHMSADDIRGYKSLVNEHRYRAYIVDFSGVDKEDCLSRDDEAGEPLREDACAIESFYAHAFKAPSGFEVVSPEDATSLVFGAQPYDLSGYAAVNFFGDVHGCHTALMGILGALGCEDGALNPDEFYIFCGDYVDRGLENAAALEYLMSISEEPNVMMLEGNHERWLADWSHDVEAKSKTFARKTAPELDAAGVDKKEVSRFCRTLIPMAWVEDADGRRVFACHGGVPVFPKPFTGISAKELVKGVGEYKDADDVNACWEASAGEEGIYQVHGHRNAKDTSAHPFEHVFSLEGAVEHGGELRVVRFEPGKEPHVVSVPNTVFDHVNSEIPLEDMTFDDALENLRANPMVKEKHLPGGVSSFNFTREAFLKSAWDAQSIKARGLFIDTDNGMMMARSYDKFFNIGEQEDTEASVLAKKFVYPVSVYKKENGYLGIAAPEGDGKLFFASKTTTQGDYAVEFKRLLISALGGSLSKFADYLEDIDASAVFEVIIPAFDRHIVEYDMNDPHVVLLDIIYNDFEFGHVDYEELRDVASKFKLRVKDKVLELHTMKQFAQWYETVSAPGFIPEDGEPLEGYVLEDADGYMVKVKCDWYRYWKSIRAVIHDVMKRDRSSRVPQLVREHPETEELYEWLKRYIYDWRKAGNVEDPHVIDVRNAWESRG